MFGQAQPLQSLGMGAMPHKQGGGTHTTPQRHGQHNQHQFHSERPRNKQDRQNQVSALSLFNEIYEIVFGGKNVLCVRFEIMIKSLCFVVLKVALPRVLP